MPGDRVRRGQTLVVLDGRDLSAAARQATTARSAQDEGVLAARAALEAARAGQVLARANHTRIAALASRKAATAQELDGATSARAAADAQVAGAEAQVRQAEAGLASAGNSDQAGVMASFATVTAFDGVGRRENSQTSARWPHRACRSCARNPAFHARHPPDRARRPGRWGPVLVSTISLRQDADVRVEGGRTGPRCRFRHAAS
jgi:hypothetical protein